MSRSRPLLRWIASGLTAPGLVLLFACASSGEPEGLQWHSVDPERDTIPYIVDDIVAGRELASSPAPSAPAARAAAPAPVAASAPAASYPGGGVAATPSPPPLPTPASTPAAPQRTPLPVAPSPGMPAPFPEGAPSRESASAVPAKAVAPLPGELAIEPEEPRALPLPAEPIRSEAERSEARLVPTKDEEVLEVVRDPELDAEAARVGSASASAGGAAAFAAGTSPGPGPDPDLMEPMESGTWSDSVVARVNGAPILYSELKEFAMEENLPLAGLTADGTRGEAFRRAMTARVDQTLLIQAANLESLEPDQLEVARRVDAFIAQRIDEAGGRAEFIQSLRGAQLNLESFRQLLVRRESQRQLASGIVSRRVTISSSELEAFKRQRREAGEPLEEVQLAQILIGCPSSEQGTEFGAEQYRRALDIAARAGRQPAAFSRIIADINTDPTGRESGGLIGWVEPSSLQPTLAAAVAKMRRGEVSEPVASDTGYHVLFVVDRRDARDMLYARRFEEERNRLIEELRAKAQIEIYPIEGAG